MLLWELVVIINASRISFYTLFENLKSAQTEPLCYCGSHTGYDCVSYSKCQSTGEKGVNFERNENANSTPPCRPGLSVSITIQKNKKSKTRNLCQNSLQSAQMWLLQITSPSYFHHSLPINQSPLSLCSLLVSVPRYAIDSCHPWIGLGQFSFIPLFSTFSLCPLKRHFLITIKSCKNNEF